MRWRLIGVLTAGVLVASACGQATGTASPSHPSSSSPAASASRSGTTGAPPSPKGSAVASATLPPPDLTDTTYKATTPKARGGSVTLAEWQFPDMVNPYYATSSVAWTDIVVSDSMFDSLVTVTPDLKYAPDLAMNVPTLDNGGVVLKGSGMDVTWKLHPGMEWSDGQPINCDDIKATWQWILNADQPTGVLASGTIGWQDVTGVDGGNGTTCVMHFGKVYEGYLTLVHPLLPAHYITTVPVKNAVTQLYPLSDLSSGVYSGPYIPVSVTSRSKIALEPNPNWGTISGHAPWLSSVSWKFYGDFKTMIDGFEGGEYDVGQDLNNDDDPALTAIGPAKKISSDSLTYELLAFNNASIKTKFGSDTNTIIGAIKLATDREAIAQLPLVGDVTVTNDFVSPKAWYYEDTDGSTAADPTTAFTLLANAGWAKGADGYLTKGGKVLELNYCSTTRQFRLDTLSLMANQLRQIGIKVDINAVVDSQVFGAWGTPTPPTPCNLRDGNFDVAEFSYVSRFDPLDGYTIYYSSQTPDNLPHDGGNITRISLPALDAAYDAVAGTVDFSQLRSAMFAIQDIYASDRNTYELPLYFRKDIWLVNPKVHNFTGNPTSSAGEWNIGDWWVG
jgi:peptide/nickel transport system substrate-binding protein